MLIFWFVGSLRCPICLTSNENPLAAFVSADGDEVSLASVKASHAEEKADFEKSFAASEERLMDAERRIQEVEHSKNTLDDLATRIDVADAKLKSSEWKVHFLENKLCEQSKQFFEKDADSSGYCERVVILEKDLANVSVDFERLTTQHTVD